MPRTWIDMGTSGMLSPEAGRGFQKVRALYMNRKRDLYVMSVGEGDHQMNSRHYGCPIAFSDAFDIAINSVPKHSVESVLGKDWDVVEYKAKGIYHIEYDPK